MKGRSGSELACSGMVPSGRRSKDQIYYSVRVPGAISISVGTGDGRLEFNCISHLPIAHLLQTSGF